MVGGAARGRGRPPAPATAARGPRAGRRTRPAACGRSAPSTARSSASAPGRDQRTTSASRRSVLRPRLPQPPGASRPQRRDVRRPRPSAGRPDPRAGRPATASTASASAGPTSRARPAPRRPGPARPARPAGPGGAVAARPVPGAPSRSVELQHDPLRALAADAGHPGQRVSGPGRRPRARSPSGVCTASIAWASRGPTPLAVCSSSKTSRSSASANPNRVSESSRTTSDWWPARPACPDPQPGQRGRRGLHQQADPADLDHRRVQPHGEHPSADRGDHTPPHAPRGRTTRSVARPAHRQLTQPVDGAPASAGGAAAPAPRPPRRCAGPSVTPRPAGAPQRAGRPARGGRSPAPARRRRPPGCGGLGQRAGSGSPSRRPGPCRPGRCR